MNTAIDLEPAIFPLVSIRRVEQLLGRSRDDLHRLAAHAGRYYRPFDQIQPRTGKVRHIDNPIGELKDIQSRIQSAILRRLPLPDTMLGGIRRRSIRDNARYHVAQPVVIALDLRDCFPRTHDLRVFEAICRMLGASTEIADLLTKLTTFQHRVPQGAPTSGTLVNWVLLPMHDEIQELARGRRFRCTFYVDDITLSGLAALYELETIVHTIQHHGYSIRHRKLHVMPACVPQEVTGVLVNRRTAAPRPYRDGIRATILNLSEKTSISERELGRVRGMISHVRYLRRPHGESLERLFTRLLAEKMTAPDNSTPTGGEILYVPCRNPRRHRRREGSASPTHLSHSQEAPGDANSTGFGI